jgi:NAD(P)H dehydrogenase (quinone)
MRTLATIPPIQYRKQNGGDYLIPSMQLRPELANYGAEGFKIHLKLEDAEDTKEVDPRFRGAEYAAP